ncbi:MAG: hypothetical protein HRT88_02100 [Lentisphaeraceae bacterium]|nr:hypothetical protein [Lentisphaeraceae bacterium]
MGGYISESTIKRAEKGKKILYRTANEIAAVFGVDIANLVQTDPVEERQDKVSSRKIKKTGNKPSTDLVAQQFKEVNLFVEAVEVWSLAAQNAMLINSPMDCISHSQNALNTLKLLPFNKQRKLLEIEIQQLYAAGLKAIRGLGSPEVGAALERALELSKDLHLHQESANILVAFPHGALDS